jgi:lysophospholipase L1-like esterase
MEFETMKNILCYGDSNTFGWDPEKISRLELEERWLGVMVKELGVNYHIIAKDLPGHTTVFMIP